MSLKTLGGNAGSIMNLIYVVLSVPARTVKECDAESDQCEIRLYFQIKYDFFVEKWMKSRISQMAHRCSQCIYTPIIWWAMSQFLPKSEFKWLTEEKIEIVNNMRVPNLSN